MYPTVQWCFQKKQISRIHANNSDVQMSIYLLHIHTHTYSYIFSRYYINVWDCMCKWMKWKNRPEITTEIEMENCVNNILNGTGTTKFTPLYIYKTSNNNYNTLRHRIAQKKLTNNVYLTNNTLELDIEGDVNKFQHVHEDVCNESIYCIILYYIHIHRHMYVYVYIYTCIVYYVNIYNQLMFIYVCCYYYYYYIYSFYVCWFFLCICLMNGRQCSISSDLITQGQ